MNGWGPALQHFRPRAVDPKGMGGNPSFTDPRDYSLTTVRLYKLRLNKPPWASVFPSIKWAEYLNYLMGLWRGPDAFCKTHGT